MAKKAKKRSTRQVAPSGDDRGIITQREFMQQVTDVLTNAKWKVLDQRRESTRRFGGDLLAGRVDLGRERRYAIDCLLDVDGGKIHERFSAFQNYARQAKQPFSDFDEYWLVGYHFSTEAMRRNPGNDRRFRVLNLDELRELLAPPKPPRTRQSRATTKIGKAIEANEQEITVAVSGLILQIEDKLEKARDERPNSDEAKAKAAEEISELEKMKAELKRIRGLVADFTKGKAPEKDVVKSVKTFRDDLQGWWDKSHTGLLSTTAKAALFVSSAGVLTLMGANTPSALAIAGALIGGKVVKKGLKKVGKMVRNAIQ